MSRIDRFIDAFDQVPRDEPLGRIQMVPQGEELSDRTIQRLHSDAELTDADKFFLGKWAKAHGYDPDLLVEEKRLRLLEDCEHPNHRPISEHWAVDCSDHGVTVPDAVGDWHRVDDSLYWRPVVWECVKRGNGNLAVRGMYGKWTVTTGIGELGKTLVEDVPAAEAIDAATEYMTSDSSSPKTKCVLPTSVKIQDKPDDLPDWCDAFPEQIGEFQRFARVNRADRTSLTYWHPIPDKTPAHKISVVPNEEEGWFDCRESYNPDKDDVKFRRSDAQAAANALIAYIQEADVQNTDAAAPAPPNWINAFPREIGDWTRRSPRLFDGGMLLDYRTDHGQQDERVCIYQQAGTFSCRIRGEWPDRPVTDWDLIFQRDDVTAAANVFSQYLQDGVEPAPDYDPHPNRPWPPEDLFTADTS